MEIFPARGFAYIFAILDIVEMPINLKPPLIINNRH